MPLALSTDHLARLEAASRVLLGPLAAPDPEAWVLEVGRVTSELLGGERAVLLLPPVTTTYVCEGAPEIVRALEGLTDAITPEGAVFHDDVVNLWHRLRRERRQEAFSFDLNARMVAEHGYGMDSSPIVNDVVLGRRYRDFAGLLTTTTAGDAMVWVLHEKRGGTPFGDDVLAVLRALVPSFRAGIEALHRLGAYRAALDGVAEPLAEFDADGRERYRNAALTRLLADEPERGRIELGLRALARALRPLAAPTRRDHPAGMPAPMERAVETARGRYVLRGALVSGWDGAGFLVTVAADVAPAFPTAEEVRARHGLTRREAEVALLVAEGLKNDEIAGRLFVSPHTARHHVEGVLAKLGVGSRAAVAARLLQPA